MSFELDFPWYGEEETCLICGTKVGIATDRQMADLEKTGQVIRPHDCEAHVKPYDTVWLTKKAVKNGINPEPFDGGFVLQVMPSGLAIVADASRRGKEFLTACGFISTGYLQKHPRRD